MKTWQTWLIGLVEATLSGGTVAISTNWVDPHDFNVLTRKFWLVVLASSLMSATKYVTRTLAKLRKENGDDDAV